MRYHLIHRLSVIENTAHKLRYFNLPWFLTRFALKLALHHALSFMSLSKRSETALEETIFRGRWLLAPFYLGLVISILLLLTKFAQELWHLLSHVTELSESQVIVGVLALVDMSLVASLLLMITFSGYEIFVSKIDLKGHADRPDWMGKVDFSGLKLKVIGAIVAISAIDLLRSFVDIPDVINDEQHRMYMWKVIVHLTFVVSGVLFAIMDKVAGDTKKH